MVLLPVQFEICLYDMISITIKVCILPVPRIMITQVLGVLHSLPYLHAGHGAPLWRARAAKNQ